MGFYDYGVIAPDGKEISMKEYEGKVDVYKVNTVYDLDLVDKFEIMSNPALLLFKGGAAKDRSVGAKNYNELKAWVDGLL